MRTAIVAVMTGLALVWPIHQYDETFRTEMRSVAIADHRILVSQFEVTATSWLQCYNQGGCEHNAVEGKPFGAYPVTGVNWFDVNQYLAWANSKAGGGLRLPTLAEWRVINFTLARPKPAQLFTDPRMAWAADYGQEKAAIGPVQKSGSFSTTHDGIADLDGNVWEWTSSCFRADRDDSCPAYVVAGEHEANVSVFVREPTLGGCASGTPPTHLGFRLVADQ
jgi:formylglycine-generating enzyme required for sulfatase activity